MIAVCNGKLSNFPLKRKTLYIYINTKRKIAQKMKY